MEIRDDVLAGLHDMIFCTLEAHATEKPDSYFSNGAKRLACRVTTNLK